LLVFVNTEGAAAMASKASSSRQRYWMAIESLNNWVADKGNSFRFTGVTGHRTRLAGSVKEGDLIFMYIPSPHSSFSDLRRVVTSGLSRSVHAREYDIPCSLGVNTMSIIELDPKIWVRIAPLVGKLSFLKIVPRWGYALRTSFREITPPDARVIVQAMAKAKPDRCWSSVLKDIETMSSIYLKEITTARQPAAIPRST
jgi:hypothetical protein